ncbi:hypothetical protein ACLS0R_11660 [Comamonas jiangduensis]|uniref:hypothetical protein n=1 Tax=Comamonas jiangduensis TaxID=1194168 RepID=UPI00214ABEAA
MNEEIENLRAFTFGMQAALVASIGALIRTHPDPEALSKMLDLYRQREQAYLENKPLPEKVLDSFQQMWKRIDIEIQHTLQERQQLVKST